MKILIFVTLLAIVSSRYDLKVSDIEQAVDRVAAFRQFKSTYNKTYDEIHEEIKRFTIFTDNLKNIQEIQERDPGAEYGVTQFADLTTKEFQKKYLTLLPPTNLRDFNEDYHPSEQAIKDTPDTYNWTAQGAVTSVQNQGNCGSCWAFSAVANVEGQYFIKHKNLKKFSEQQLVSCDNIDAGCNGGWQEWAFQYINETGGIELDSDYPYTSGKNTKFQQCTFDLYKEQAQVSRWKFISQDPEDIKTVVHELGPLSIGVDARAWQFYKSGISNPLLLCADNAEAINHGILLVGYGIGKSKLGQELPYWLVKNSWGVKWGENGYIRAIRGKGKCGINKHVLTSEVI